MRELNIPEVGLFFYIKGRLFCEGIPITEVSEQTGFKNIDLGHMEYFDDIVELFPELELLSEDDYGEFPRGRVVYSVSKDIFYVYMDKCLLNQNEIKINLKNEFNLNNSTVEFLYDEHYQCAGCNPEIKRVSENIKKIIRENR